MTRAQHMTATPTSIRQAVTAPLALVDAKDGPRIDSRMVAENLGSQHRSVFNLINTHKADFNALGKLRFEIAPSPDSRTGQAVRFAMLTEDHCYLLLTYTRNTERTRSLKVKLVQAFSAARRNAQQRQTEYLPEYHHLHDRIKVLAGDSDHARFVHMNVNRLVNKVAGIEAGQRHTIPVAMLTAVNHVAALAMAGAADHHQGYARAKAALGTLQGLLAPPESGPDPYLNLSSGRADHGL